MCKCEETLFHFPDGRIQPQQTYLLCANSVDGKPCGRVEFVTKPERTVPGPGVSFSPPASPVSSGHREHRVSLVEPTSSSPVSEPTVSSSSGSRRRRPSSGDKRVLLQFKLPFSSRGKSKKEKKTEKRKSNTPEVVVHQHHHSYAPQTMPVAPDPPPATSMFATTPGGVSSHFGVTSPNMPPSPLSEASTFGSRPQSTEMPGMYGIRPVYVERVPPSRRSSNPTGTDLGSSGVQSRSQDFGGQASIASSSPPTERPGTSSGRTFAQRSSQQSSKLPDIDDVEDNSETQRAALREEARKEQRRQQQIADLEHQLNEAHDELANLRFRDAEAQRENESRQQREQQQQIPRLRPASPPTPQAAQPSLQRQYSSAGSSVAPSTASAAERNRQTAANTAINKRGYAPHVQHSSSHRHSAHHDNTERHSRTQQRRSERAHGQRGQHPQQRISSSYTVPSVPSAPPQIHHIQRTDTGSALRPGNGPRQYQQRPATTSAPTQGPSSGSRTGTVGQPSTITGGNTRAQNVQNQIARLESEILTLRRVRHGIEEGMAQRVEEDARADAAERERDRRRLSAYDRLNTSTRMPWDRSPPPAESPSSPPSRDAEGQWAQRLRHSRETSDDLRGMFEKVGLGVRDVKQTQQQRADSLDETIDIDSAGERERRRY